MDIQWTETETPNYVTITGTLDGCRMSIQMTQYEMAYDGCGRMDYAKRQIERALQDQLSGRGRPLPYRGGPAFQPYHTLSQYPFDYQPDYTLKWDNYFKRSYPSAEDMAAFNELDQEGD